MKIDACNDMDDNSPISPVCYSFKIKHKYFCEYKYCECRDKKLPPFKNEDWELRMTHKKCYLEMCNSNLPNSQLILTNDLNPVYDKCKCNKLNGEPCKMKSNTEGFNKKFGYCKYHNYKKFHKIYN